MKASVAGELVVGAIKGDDITGIIVAVLVAAYLIYILIRAERM